MINYSVQTVRSGADVCTLLSPMLWYFFSMMVLTGSSSLNVMKQKPRLLFVLFSMGSSMDSTWSYDHITIHSVKRRPGNSVQRGRIKKKHPWGLYFENYLSKGTKILSDFLLGGIRWETTNKNLLHWLLALHCLGFFGINDFAIEFMFLLCSNLRKKWGRQLNRCQFTALFAGFTHYSLSVPTVRSMTRNWVRICKCFTFWVEGSTCQYLLNTFRIFEEHKAKAPRTTSQGVQF